MEVVIRMWGVHGASTMGVSAGGVLGGMFCSLLLKRKDESFNVANENLNFIFNDNFKHIETQQYHYVVFVIDSC